MTERGKEILDAVARGGCAVLGMGVSNLPLAAFLMRFTDRITLRDAKPAEQLPEGVGALCDKGATLVAGDGYMENLDEAVLFRSPGMRPDLPALAAAVARGAILSSEAELFLELCPAHTVGITGSDGKTTTTTLTHLLLSAVLAARGGAAKATLGGNIGIPLIPLLDTLTPEDFAVCELSSFQLHAATRGTEVAVITNLSPNHLNWHTDMAEYVEAKTHILRAPCRALVTNAENEITAGVAASAPVPVTLFGRTKRPTGGNARIWLENNAIYYESGAENAANAVREILYDDVRTFLLPGLHNVENYMTAAASVLACGASTDELRAALRAVAPTFGGVEHRLEFVRERRGVRFYNSSIDSSPTRTAAALSVFPDGKNVVICGGSDKHIPFAPLAETLCRFARAVVLTGQAAPQIDAALAECPLLAASGLVVLREPSFCDAVHRAAAVAREGERVLLSPACASFDAFPNFAVRGNTFKALVRALDD